MLIVTMIALSKKKVIVIMTAVTVLVTAGIYILLMKPFQSANTTVQSPSPSVAAEQVTAVDAKQVPAPVAGADGQNTFTEIATTPTGNRTIKHFAMKPTVRPAGSKQTIELSKVAIEKIMKQIQATKCDDSNGCDFALWDAQDSYKNAQSTLAGNPTTIISANKAHLMSYVSKSQNVTYYSTVGDDYIKSLPETKMMPRSGSPL